MDTESPREAISKGVSIIAERLADTGFSLLKKKRHLRRISGDLTFSIEFRSNKFNRTGGLAETSVYVGVASEKLAKWRLAHVKDPSFHKEPGASVVVYACLGNLLVPRQPLLRWDFSDEKTRIEVAVDAADKVRDVVLLFFDQFQDTQAVVDSLIKHTVCNPPYIVEYATAVLGVRAAKRTLEAELDRFANARADYNEARLYLSTVKGFRPKPGVGGELALLASSCGFDEMADD